MLLIGYFEGIRSERGIAWRCADSLALGEFISYALQLRRRTIPACRSGATAWAWKP